MRYSLGQGSADSVPVSSYLSCSPRCVFAAARRSPGEFLCFWRKLLPLNNLPPLGFSLLFFSCSLPLFSSVCSLFFQNTGGMVSRSRLWIRGGIPRRLPMPEANLRDTRNGKVKDVSLIYITPFKINTCKSVSKQTTLTPFGINTCEKTGGEGGQLSLHFRIPRYVPSTAFPGGWQIRRSHKSRTDFRGAAAGTR